MLLNYNVSIRRGKITCGENQPNPLRQPALFFLLWPLHWAPEPDTGGGSLPQGAHG